MEKFFAIAIHRRWLISLRSDNILGRGPLFSLARRNYEMAIKFIRLSGSLKVALSSRYYYNRRRAVASSPSNNPRRFFLLAPLCTESAVKLRNLAYQNYSINQRVFFSFFLERESLLDR